MFFTYYDANVLKNKKENLTNETFKDYIDYVTNYYNIKEANIGTSSNSYAYMIITEIENNGKNYYANIPIE